MNLREIRSHTKRNLIMALIAAAGYLTVFLTGKLLWFDTSEGLAPWLTSICPKTGAGYTFGWILGNNLFWYSMAVSVIPALFGRYRFSFVTLAGCVTGILAGIIAGFYPEVHDYYVTDYGWFAWILTYLLSIAAGILTEIFIGKRRNKYEQTNNGTDKRRSI